MKFNLEEHPVAWLLVVVLIFALAGWGLIVLLKAIGY